MSNETGLDWLARNVQVWPEGKREALVCWPRNVDALIWSCVLSNTGWITKEQWLARRAELQNKPSWDDAPSDMKWLAQDGDGQWYWYCSAPFVDETNDDKVWDFGDSFDHEDCEFGEVLGDWRDTLEKRPEEFQPFTSIEDNQEKAMKQDNGWFERGELPPVGAVCLYVISDRLSAEVEITAHAKFGLCFVEVGKSGENYVSKTAELHRFRPIRTEREVLLSIIVEEMNRYDTDGKLADAILAAGFSLGAK